MAEVLKKTGCADLSVAEQIEKISALFDHFDADHNGTLSKEELLVMLEKKNAGSKLEAYFRYCDLDADNKITKEEFAKGLVGHSIEEKFTSICREFDADGNGSVDHNEIKGILGQCGFNDIDDAAIDRLIAELDTNNDGKLDYAEFVKNFLSAKL